MNNLTNAQCFIFELEPSLATSNRAKLDDQTHVLISEKLLLNVLVAVKSTVQRRHIVICRGC